MKKRKSEDFEWLEICKYNIDSYNNGYNNDNYNILKINNIECLNQLEYYCVNNVEKCFNCTLFVQREDYEKGIELLKKNNV